MARRVKKETKALQEARKFLASVPEEYVFWCRDDRVLRDMRELGEALTTMSDETFVYHSNAEKKDFSNWVRDIIGDKQLAKRLETTPNRIEAASEVANRLAALSRKLV